MSKAKQKNIYVAENHGITPPIASSRQGSESLSLIVALNPLSAMKQGYHLLSLCVVLLLFMAASCTRAPESEGIAEAISDIQQLSHSTPDSALLLLDALWEEKREQLTDRDKISLHFARGYILVVALRETDALNYFSKALQIAEQTNAVEKKVLSLSNIAYIKLTQGDTQGAFDRLYQAQLLLGTQTDTSRQALIPLYQVNSIAFFQIGQIDFALDYARQALDMAKQEGYRESEALILKMLSFFLFNFENYLQAEENMREAIAILHTLDNFFYLFLAYANLSAALAQQDRLEEATAYAQKANEMASLIGLPAFAMQGVYNRKGEIYFRKGQYENSLAMHHKALELRTIGGDILLQAASKNAIGAAYNQIGNHDRALYYVDQALQIAQAAQGTRLLIDVYDNLATIYASQDDLRRFRQTIAVRDSLQTAFRSEQHNRAIQDLRTRNEIAQREQKIAQQAQDLQRNIIIITLLIITVSLIFVLFVLRTLYERRKMQNIKRIVQQYEANLKLKQETQHQTENRKKDLIISEMSEKLMPEIERLFNEEKIYRRQGLTTDDVAKMLNTNQRYLSKIINECYQTTFPEFVKAFRIDEAVEMLKDMHTGGKFANYTLEAIAEEVGFIGRNTFRTAFKEIIGVTPTEYLQALKSS